MPISEPHASSQLIIPEVISFETASVYAADTAPLRDDAAFAGALALVSRERAEKAARAALRERAAQSVAAELLLRLALRDMGIAAEPEFAVTERGKPYLSNISGIRFNLSHTHGRAACSVTRGADVGVDIERVRDADLRVAKRCFTPAERESVASAPEDRRDAVFFRIWAQKESVIKALGGGVSMRGFEVMPDGAVAFTDGKPRGLRVSGGIFGEYALAICIVNDD